MYEVQRGSRGVIGTSVMNHATFGNHLLDALPREEVGRLSAHLRRVFLHRGQILASPGDAAEFLYFPIDALLWSWTTTTGAERPTSLLTTGRRGAMSLDSLLDLPSTHGNVAVLSPGSAWRVARTALESLSRAIDSPIRRMLTRFAYASFAVCAYRLACNSEHNVDRRLARWLLFIMDETGKPEASLTHQQIADVAAIRRPSVSLAFSDLQRRGIVRVHHGLVQILNRERLERETCPCYTAIRVALEDALSGESLSELSASG
ncbi:MAG: Crp/Fnr family transcriptional regulator [Candidatus Eremiobacteraeota bacterium]|nr:Crp/Fnr family transcriptional regulator [Candidatus Eremiobacteraeota bacterium]